MLESIINQVSYIKKGSSKLDRADDALGWLLTYFPTLGNFLVRWDLLKGTNQLVDAFLEADEWLFWGSSSLLPAWMCNVRVCWLIG